MSKTFSDKAIILKRTNFSEADRILSVLTESHGKLSVRAKGVRKITAKLAGHVELLAQSELFLAQGNKFLILAGARAINMYARVREDFEKMSIAFELVEIVEKNLREGMPHKDIFELTVSALDYLDRKPYSLGAHSLLKPYFTIKLLSYLGYEPQVNVCAHCHGSISEGSLRFSFSLGGLLCDNCFDIDPDAFLVTIPAIKVLRIFLTGRIEIVDRFKLNPNQVKEVQDISNKLLMYRLEPPAKAEKFIEKMKVAENRV